MPVTARHEPGTFCWFECGTTDQAGGREFYRGLFGWEVEEHPMGPDAVYTTFRLGGNDVAALYGLMPQQRAEGVPSHWLPYVSVASADATAARAAELGGTVLAPPMDVMEHGRMAVLREPTGAVFAVWEARKHPGATRLDEPGAVCWNELNTREPGKSVAFLAALFGWTAQAVPMQGVDYTMLMRGERPAGGVMPMTAEWGDLPSHWMTYFQVADCDATAARAAELGGRVAHGPFDAPPVGRMAVILDPQGAVFSIIRMAEG